MRLSIITINRNNAEGLRETMGSVFRQTYCDFEYIVIDGASTDGSVNVIREMSASLKKGLSRDKSLNNALSFNWISESDSGIYEAMNKGIRKAKGEYCLFLNSGDFLIASDVLERVFAQNPEADIICARCNVSDNGKVVWTSPYLPKVTLKDLYFVGIPHQSTFICRSLFEKYGMYREDFRYNSDIDFWYKAIVLGEATTQGVDVITTDYNLDGVSAHEAHNKVFINEHKQIEAQGFLPKVLPDYECWREERKLLSKYRWIEQHKWLQKCLNIYRRISRHI